MMPPDRGTLAKVTTLVLLLLLAAGCGGPAGEPEQALRAWVARGEEAAEMKDRGVIMDMISPAYTDARGNSRDDIGNVLRIYFLRQNSIALITRIDEITVHAGTAADLAVQIGVAGTNDNLPGFDADAYRVEMELQLDSDRWQLISAKWGKIGDDVR